MYKKLAFARHFFNLLFLLICFMHFYSCRDGKNKETKFFSKSISQERISSSHVEESPKPESSVAEKANAEPTIKNLDSLERPSLYAATRAEKIKTLKNELFSIPLRGEAALDRNKAWEILIVPDNDEYLSPKQYKYACELLSKYTASEPLEKLVFWRLVRIQILLNSPSGTSRSSASEYTVRTTNEKLREFLYSALGQHSENISYNEADNRAIEILRKASPK